MSRPHPKSTMPPYRVGIRSRHMIDEFRVHEDMGVSLVRDSPTLADVREIAIAQAVPCQLIRQGRKPIPA